MGLSAAVMLDGPRLSLKGLRVWGGGVGAEGGQRPDGPFTNVPFDFTSYHKHAASILKTHFKKQNKTKTSRFQRPFPVLGNVAVLWLYPQVPS